MTLAAYAADVIAAGRIPEWTDESLAVMNAHLRHVTVSAEDVADHRGTPRPCWVVTGPVATRAGGRTGYRAVLPVCVLEGCLTGKGARVCPTRHLTYEARRECAGKTSNRGIQHCTDWHAGAVLRFAKTADATYRSKAPSAPLGGVASYYDPVRVFKTCAHDAELITVAPAPEDWPRPGEKIDIERYRVAV